ncbi:hypothetical protein [Pseudolactococcus insecticola]|uniref:MORN repeat protein n=1 Tax=Pseudolactococcus insecticola TaxID=2709158 RepID=A0A6A0B533_9LACT|nr:hypothetical protein [Lactococcus insecticola]GFH40509.1 hypothetical protein Hs20B_09070 [Lactococcus insecticola]
MADKVTQTFKEKLAELEEKRRSEQEKLSQFDLENPEFQDHLASGVMDFVADSDVTLKSSDQSKPAEKQANKRTKNQIKPMTLAIFVSLFVIILARLYALDYIGLKKEVTQKSLDNSFTYKGGLAQGNFSGAATITDKKGNTLKGTFKAGKLAGNALYTQNGGYVVKQKNDQSSVISLADKTVVTLDKDKYSTKAQNFSYTGTWRFAGSWQGQMTFANQASYMGAWKNGLPDGQGTYTTIDGTPIKATFKFGVPKQ